MSSGSISGSNLPQLASWEIDMSARKIKGRGVGRTFGATLDDVAGLSF
jgi:hypothetical protein